MTSSRKLICNFIVWHALWIFWSMGEITIKGAKALLLTIKTYVCTIVKTHYLFYLMKSLFIFWNWFVYSWKWNLMNLKVVQYVVFVKKNTQNTCYHYIVFKPLKIEHVFLLLKLSPNVFKKIMGPLNLKHFIMVFFFLKIDKKALVDINMFFNTLKI
jgi:hypothetical protein